MRLKSTLEQWITLQAIDRCGSIQAAAEKLNKSHTTLIYTIKKLEDQLALKLIQVKGKKTRLTLEGKTILRRADAMIEQAQQLEVISQQLQAGTETEITLSLDHLCDPNWVYPVLARFYQDNPTTSIQLVETTLSGTQEAVLSQKADVAIINIPITDYPADIFGNTKMLAVIASHHPLAQKEKHSLSDLKTITQIVIRDAPFEANITAFEQENKQENINVGWLKAEQRLTLDNFEQALAAVKAGIGFCRLPEHLIQANQDDKLMRLRLDNSMSYQIPTHLTLPKGEDTGPAARQLYELLLASASERL
ncbi:putative transcriptional regulator [Marinomonas sp. MED121]|uniref:LysR family transcriptional regulator n=1 Tax=Marinomonas sp. MED121 TaxID=314277 RepID=UPI000068FF8F|nr:LysR family transcriptional regulator [Marinomonas sp. MED121]EAQ66723.1 putative transcriptional regulator [Marinomonas sp. MED121]